MATITGSGGVDQLTGSGLADQIDGLGAADIINGGGGADIINGGAGDDLLHGDNVGIRRIGTGATSRASVSADGTKLVFTTADALIAGDSNGLVDVYLVDLRTGALSRVNTHEDGTQTLGSSPAADALLPVISADGSKVMFTTAAKVSQFDDDAHQDVYIKTLATGALQSNGVTFTSLGASTGYSFSPDGSKVLFSSASQLFVQNDTNTVADLFAWTLGTGNITRVNTTSSGGEVFGGGSFEGEFSPDGTKVVFASDASTLVSGDGNVLRDIFVKDLTTGAVTRVNTSAGGAEALQGASDHPHFSPDGTKVLFESAANNLVANDTNGATDIFIKDLTTGVVTRVSTPNPKGGTQGTVLGGGGAFNARFSADGTKVVFQSTFDNLVSGDGNRASDIFVKTLSSGAITLISETPAGVAANGGSFDPVFLPDGTVAFRTDATNLFAGDSNGVTDLVISYAGFGADILNGGDGDDQIFGDEGADTLIGGTGNDTLAGGTGDDAYEVTEAGDVVVEAVSEGTDTVVSYVSGYSLGANVENLVMGGSIAVGFGNSGANAIFGNAANNTLNGAGGADVMIGGAGNDDYQVADVGDQVLENAGEGIDSVFSFLTEYGIGDNVENLILQGSALVGFGNAGDNGLFGTAGNNTLIGLGGNDLMVGGDGNDTYEVTEAGDVVQEQAGAAAGVDQVFSLVEGYVLAPNVENLILAGSTVTGFGGAGNNGVIGNGAANNLGGGGGDDTLIGNGGTDVFFWTGTSAGKDIITDFDALGLEKVVVSQSMFQNFAVVLSKSFQAGADTVIGFDSNTVLVLKNVARNNLTANNFVFSASGPDDELPPAATVGVTDHVDSGVAPLPPHVLGGFDWVLA